MAAFSYEDANKTWQRVRVALAGANPGIQAAFKDLKSYLSQHSAKTQLQFLAFTDAQAIVNLGTQLGSGAASLFAIYVIKNGTSGTGTATDSFLSVHDGADNSSSATVLATLALLVANDQRMFVDFAGVPIATGAVISAATAPGGATESTAGDAGNGFILVG